MKLEQGELAWTPDSESIARATLTKFSEWLADSKGLGFSRYEDLWAWSTDDVGGFWKSIWDFFDIQADGSPEPVLGKAAMPGAEWFPSVRLNYAEHVFRNASASRPAIIFRSESGERRQIPWAQLAAETAAVAEHLKKAGVVAGDRVVAFLPNIPETVTAFLACASIGAIWSSCSPDMGAGVVLDRFKQIDPKIIIATDGYAYGGKFFDRTSVVQEILDKLPTLQEVVYIPGAHAEKIPDWPKIVRWSEITAQQAELRFDRFPFDHPLWIVYSSGTTGLPKAMVHGHGGILLTQLKTQQLQHDLRKGDRLLFLGSTGWIVWNHLVGGLLSGATIMLYDGNPMWPEKDVVWGLLSKEEVTHFGCGAAYLIGCMKAELAPRESLRFDNLRAINSTGSPLPVDAYRWVYENVKGDVWLASVSGGTDIASGFVACAPWLPVYAGELQCRELGVSAFAYDEEGKSVLNQVGELVVTKPMPSMPLYFWNDPGNKRYLESYFDHFPGVWRHGDWIEITDRGTAVIYGRSDTTINRNGIRMGTSEIYKVVEAMPQVADSLVVDLEFLGRPSYMPMFVVMRPGHPLTEELIGAIKQEIRAKASARHVPDQIYEVDDIPRTLTGKKMELPVRKILLGQQIDLSSTKGSMANPSTLDFFIGFKGTLGSLNP
ncbi:MAG: acetoacetate--CoA ligase [Rhodocyclaceae bacterium]|nr:MAG: acetoacetate--CoA ligase [Rhodocyclaceae bacterium]